MKKYIFDSSALISYFDGDQNAERVANILEEINEKELESFVCVVNLGEVYYHFLREGGYRTSDVVLSAIKTLPIKIVEANIELTLAASKIKAFNKMSYADCFAAALAENKKGILLTSDKEFKQVEKNIKVEFL